jgi:hypothetical protein
MTVYADNASIGLLGLGDHWILESLASVQPQFYARSRVVSNLGRTPKILAKLRQK